MLKQRNPASFCRLPTYVSKRTSFRELAGRFQNKWFIIDEAFMQFADRWKDNSGV